MARSAGVSPITSRGAERVELEATQRKRGEARAQGVLTKQDAVMAAEPPVMYGWRACATPAAVHADGGSEGARGQGIAWAEGQPSSKRGAVERQAAQAHPRRAARASKHLPPRSIIAHRWTWLAGPGWAWLPCSEAGGGVRALLVCSWAAIALCRGRMAACPHFAVARFVRRMRQSVGMAIGRRSAVVLSPLGRETQAWRAKLQRRKPSTLPERNPLAQTAAARPRSGDCPAPLTCPISAPRALSPLPGLQRQLPRPGGLR